MYNNIVIKRERNRAVRIRLREITFLDLDGQTVTVYAAQSDKSGGQQVTETSYRRALIEILKLLGF